MQQGAEPSLDEILASIKKVMARDEPAGPDTGADEVDPVHEDQSADILDLAEADMLAPEEEAGAAASDGGEHSATTSAIPVAAPGIPESPPRDAARSIRESLAALERVAGPEAGSAPRGPVDPALGALTREMLRPMLAEWLEANLPAVVERLVQAEIERIMDRSR